MDSAPSRVSISNFPGDFSDPIDPDDFDAPRDAHPPSIPQMGDLHLPFDEAIKKLEGLLGFNLKPGQRKALEELHMGSDLCLIAATGFGKTIVFTGYYTLFKPEAGALTIIVSPLKAIENGQAADLWKLGSNCRPFVVVGDTNTAENRRDIALGKYTHIWISAETVLGDLVEKKSQEYKPNKSRKVTRWSGCEYEDRGTFTSVIQYTPFRQRLCLVAIDEMHLCAQISWGGSFRPAFSQLSKLRDQLEPHPRLFGTTATLRPDTWKEIRETAGFHPETRCLPSAFSHNPLP